MRVAEYWKFDAWGLAALIARKQVTATELAVAAAEAIEIGNPAINAVIEIYPDRIEKVDKPKLGDGPLHGVPFLIKDDFGHEKGRKIEFGSRLCKGMVGQADTNLIKLLRASGLNILGRSNTPEYSMAGTTENALYGNTSTPWRYGYSAGGSTGGGMAAVTAGLVPMAQGSDIGGSIRIPASWCGGVGLKPSRGRVSAGPAVDETSFGMSVHFVETKTVRDAALMLDCLAVPQIGDPFKIPQPSEPYSTLIKKLPPRLRIGWSLSPPLGVRVDREVAAAIEKTAVVLADMGHEVVEELQPGCDEGEFRSVIDIWYFGFDRRLEGYAKRNGRSISGETLEPVTYSLYQYAKTITPHKFMTAFEALNAARRRLGAIFDRCDVWLTPTTATVSEPWGHYNFGRSDVTADTLINQILNVPCQFTITHNIMGTPAISLPLAQSSDGLPIGVQLAAHPAQEHILLQLAAALEIACPWHQRIPPLHVAKLLEESDPGRISK